MDLNNINFDNIQGLYEGDIFPIFMVYLEGNTWNNSWNEIEELYLSIEEAIEAHSTFIERNREQIESFECDCAPDEHAEYGVQAVWLKYLGNGQYDYADYDELSGRSTWLRDHYPELQSQIVTEQMLGWQV